MQIIIDPGHGGFDPGGGTNEFFKEKDINLLISKYQNARFKELGINSILVRDSDETLTPKNRIDRINSFNPSSSDILISNHVNSGKDIGHLSHFQYRRSVQHDWWTGGRVPSFY